MFPSLHLDWALKPLGIFRDPHLGRAGRWILYSALIGIVSGCGAIVFDILFHLSQWGLLEKIAGFLPPGSGVEGGTGYLPHHPWLLPVVLVIGGIISGALVYGFAPEAEGHGTDAVIYAFHHLRGKIRRRVPLIKTVASAVTIGSGGSAGREGPIAQIGAGFGSFLADILQLRNYDRRIMVVAGVAGGIGSIFRAPLGAAFFAAEVLYSKPEFEYAALLPGLISSITGYTIYSSYAGWGFLFDVPQIAFHEPKQLILYTLLAVVCAAVGAIYPRVFYGIRDRIFRPLALPNWTKPAIGGLVLGVMAVAFPECLGMGYGYLQEAINGQHTIAFLLALAGMKILATSLSISSGGSGGVFGPSLVIGGSLGAAFGQAAHLYLPGMAAEPAAFTMVGMCGFFAGVANVPFASVIMVMEMTGSYGLLVPSLLAATICYLILSHSTKLYENQVPSRVESPAHLGSFTVDVLRLGKVGDFWNPVPVQALHPQDSLGRMVEVASDANQNLFPVVDAENRLVGEISMDNIRRAILAEVPREVVVAGDLMQPPVGPLVLDDSLAVAARLLAGRQSDSVIVVEDRANQHVLGVYSRRDLILAYDRQIENRRRGEEMPPEDEPF